MLDRGGPEYHREVINPERTRERFATSDFVKRLWPEPLLTDTLSFFEAQRILNRVLTEGANPFRQIEDLHLVLTRTTLDRLPRWVLGLGNHPMQERVTSMPNDGSGQVEYVLGLLALVARDYPGAARYLAQSEQRGFGNARPLLAYSLALAGELSAVRQLAQDVDLQSRPSPGFRTASSADRRHFWNWLRQTFGVTS
jgi:hypothetical protein